MTDDSPADESSTGAANEAAADSGEDVPGVDPATLQRRIDAGDPVRVLDLRNRDEVEQWHLAGPNVSLTRQPYNRFVQAQVTDGIDEFVAAVAGEGPITVVCARGEASAEVAAGLLERGHDAHNLTGGMDAWARLLLATEVDGAVGGDDDTLIQYRRPSSGCLGYLVASAGAAAVVDPLRAFTGRYVADARERGVEVETVVDTHVHADHVSGLRSLAKATGATPVMPERAVERGVTGDVTTVGDGDTLDVGDLAVEAVHAPGHTTGMTAVAVGDALLTGDSLFLDGVARPDLEAGFETAEAFARELYRTVTDRFSPFPGETVVAPGHHGEGAQPDADGVFAAPLDECRQSRVFEMGEDEFVAHVTDRMPSRPANHERIVAVNLGRESVDDEAAFELELGPNNCAAAPADD